MTNGRISLGLSVLGSILEETQMRAIAVARFDSRMVPPSALAHSSTEDKDRVLVRVCRNRRG